MVLKDFLSQKTFSSFINGKFISESFREKQELISPVTKNLWKLVIPASRKDTQTAIQAAEYALQSWKVFPAPSRGQILRKIGNLILECKDAMAEVMALEMGKPIKEGKGEVDYSAGYFFWFAGEAERIYGQTIPTQHINKRSLILKEPIGVCGIISPWNFPLAMAARKIAAAIAAGCTVIAKPSQECPITLSCFAHLSYLAGLPPGVFNCVLGPELEIGEELLHSSIVRKISFTGSTEVGKYLYAQSAPTLKKLTLELGGHAPFIITNTSHIEKAAAGAVAAKYRNNGQTCISPNRFLVQDKIYDLFVEKLVDETRKLKIGGPLDPQTEISPLLHPSVPKKIKEQVEDALQKGAVLKIGSQDYSSPSILENVTPEMKIFHEETFGPVCPLIRFKSLDEGIALANASRYGLAAYAYTENLSEAYDLIERLEYGIIGLNDPLPSSPQASFGGIKDSGFGREGGPSGINEYLTEKYVSIAL